MKHAAELILTFVMTVSAIGCMVAWYANPAWLLYMTVVPFFCAQILLCRLIKRWQIRIAPVFPVAILAGMALFYLVRDSGWDRLGALILGLACIAPTVGIVLGWLVWWSSKVLRERRQGESA